MLHALFTLMLSTTHASGITWPKKEASSWYYKKGAQFQGWKYIVIHHSATNAGSVKAFDRYHTKMGYGGIAYHFVIGNGNGMKDGELQPTFRWKDQMSGTHVTIDAWDHNIFGIGIALVGNFEKQKPTKKQLATLDQLIKQLSKQYKIPATNIIAHRHVPDDDDPKQFQQTLCPGKHLIPVTQKKKQKKKVAGKIK